MSDRAAVTEIKASTPHGIHIYAPDCPDRIDPAGEHQPIRVLPGSDTPMRAGFEEVGWGEVDGIPVVLLRPGAPTSLPPQTIGVGHVASTVSALAAFTEGRDDIFVNHRSVRDLDGRVIGARALGMFVAPADVASTAGNRRPTLTATRGLPGSGKTTWARQQDAWRINRDDLRAMVLPTWPYGESGFEDMLTRVQRAAIRALLDDRVDVVVDDTSLRPGVADALRDLAEAAGAEFVLVDFTSVPLETCIERDAARPEEERVGEHIIRTMWARHLAPLAERARQS